MKKTKQYFIIGMVCAIFIGVAILNFFVGVKPHNAHYIKLEVNPKIEFITDRNNIVTSIMPLNEEAYELLIQENFTGLSIEEATEKFIDLCTKANYIDINSKNNAVRLTIVSGFMQALELKVYETINNYFIENEILACIIENDNDRTEIKKAKENKVSSANKLSIIESILSKNSSFKFEELNKKTERDLLEILKETHKLSGYSSSNFTSTQLANKSKLIDSNRTRLEEHRKNITSNSQREFHKKYDEHKRLNLSKFKPNFESKYNSWKTA